MFYSVMSKLKIIIFCYKVVVNRLARSTMAVHNCYKYFLPSSTSNVRFN